VTVLRRDKTEVSRGGGELAPKNTYRPTYRRYERGRNEEEGREKTGRKSSRNSVGTGGVAPHISNCHGYVCQSRIKKLGLLT